MKCILLDADFSGESNGAYIICIGIVFATQNTNVWTCAPSSDALPYKSPHNLAPTGSFRAFLVPLRARFKYLSNEPYIIFNREKLTKICFESLERWWHINYRIAHISVPTGWIWEIFVLLQANFKCLSNKPTLIFNRHELTKICTNNAKAMAHQLKISSYIHIHWAVLGDLGTVTSAFKRPI